MSENDSLRRINAAKTNLMLSHPFYGYLILYLETKAVKGLDFGTMATDGYNLYYDPDGAINSWSVEELAGAIAHEISHCALGHYWRCGPRDKMIWNFAADYAINNILQEEGFTLPASCLMDTKYRNQSTEFIYSQLIKDREEMIKQLKSMDDGDLWAKCTGNGGEKPDENKKGDGQNSDGGNPKEGDDSKGQDGDLVESTISPFEIRDKEWWEEKMGAAVTFARQQGKVPAGMEGIIDGLLAPKLSWKELLRDYINSNYPNDYRLIPPNKKFIWIPIYMPRTKGNHLDIVIAMDTSGSISDITAKQFISEIREIANSFNSYNIHYMQCDAEVSFYREMTKEEEDEWPMGITGRGGTSFIPVFNKIKELDIDAPLLVYLTDMMGSFPDKAPADYSVLWVSTVENSKGPFGDTIFIDA